MSNDISISRERKLSQLPSKSLTMSEAIDLFRERVEGWLLDPAKTIEKEHGGFAIVAVTFPFIEVIGQVLKGCSTHIRLKGHPETTPYGKLAYVDAEEAFAKGFREICKNARCSVEKSVAKSLFKDLRCGVLHNASPSSGAYLEGHGKLIEMREVRGVQAAVVDPHVLLQACCNYSTHLASIVNADDTARKRFARVFHVYVGDKFGLVIDL